MNASETASASDCSNWEVTIGQPGMNGPVWCLAALPNGDLIAGGNFSTAGEVDANSIARWDGSAWHALGEGLNGGVIALVVLPEGDVIAAGSFTMAGEVQADRIARWDGSTWHALGTGVDGLVRALAVLPSGDVIAGGHFTTAGGAVVNSIARWDGVNWHSLGEGVNGTVHALEVFDDGGGPLLYAAGSFTAAGSVEVRHIAGWNGNEWSSLDHGVDGTVHLLYAHHNESGPALYAAGPSLTAAGYVPLFMGMTRWDGHAREWSPEGDGMRGNVRAMAVFDDGTGPALFAAVAGPEPGSSYIARWDGWWWLPVSSSLGGSVYALAVTQHGDAPSLYAAGTFTHAGEEEAGGIARWQFCPAPPPVVRHVPDDYTTIQAAIDASQDGDLVLVAPGTYNEAIDLHGKTIVVEGEAGAKKTIIDATGLDTSVVTVANGEGVGTTLRGFTITGGVGTISGSSRIGGGIFVRESSLTIERCTVQGNEALGGNLSIGGGIAALVDSDVLVIDTAIIGNESAIGGGAIVNHNRHARFIECGILQNTAEYTGAGVNINLGGIAVLAACTFEDNQGGGGNGVSIWGRGGTVEDCTFRSNAGGWGGAVVATAHCVIRRNQFWDNSASGPDSRGGAIYAANAEWIGILNSHFEGNSAIFGGAILSMGAAIASSTFCDNAAGDVLGIYEDLGGNLFLNGCDLTPGDLNGDNVVDVSDLLILLGAWGACPRSGECPADLNGDGFVDVSDMLILLSNWG